LRTIYKQFSESYEVVSNESKQKIVILGDISLTDKLEHIKTYIAEFMVNEGFDEFSVKDIVCYKRIDGLEIIINDYYVENQKQHSEIVQKLLAYIIQQEKNTNITRKIDTISYSEFDGVKMIPLPSNKELIATEYIEPILTMISNVKNCNGYKNLTVNLTINNIDNSNTTINNTHLSEDNNDVDIFIDYILENRPNWYKEKQWMLISTLYDHFIEVSNSTISKQRFSSLANNKLFSKKAHKIIENKKGRAILLFSFDQLEN